MSNVPLSDITIIAAALGVFFLIVAFYKSIFHKRRTPEQTAAARPPSAAAPRDDQRIKLADPFQQVPVDTLPLSHTQQPGAAAFYPAFPHPANPSVSAFRQFNPNKEFDSASAPLKNETAYEWE